DSVALRRAGVLCAVSTGVGAVAGASQGRVPTTRTDRSGGAPGHSVDVAPVASLERHGGRRLLVTQGAPMARTVVHAGWLRGKSVGPGPSRLPGAFRWATRAVWTCGSRDAGPSRSDSWQSRHGRAVLLCHERGGPGGVHPLRAGCCPPNVG